MSSGSPDLDDSTSPDPATAVLSILRELIGGTEIGLEDNFFDVGGDSLVLVRAIELLAERYGIAVPARTFIVGPAIADIALACHPLREVGL